MELLVATKGDVGLPLGMEVGTGEARFGGGEVAVWPFVVAADELELVFASFTSSAATSILMLLPSVAVLVANRAGVLLASVRAAMLDCGLMDLEPLDLVEVDMAWRAAQHGARPRDEGTCEDADGDGMVLGRSVAYP